VPDDANTAFDGTAGRRNRTYRGYRVLVPASRAAPGTAALMLDYEQVKFEHMAPAGVDGHAEAPLPARPH
jgi:hypothetical protein